MSAAMTAIVAATVAGVWSTPHREVLWKAGALKLAALRASRSSQTLRDRRAARAGAEQRA